MSCDDPRISPLTSRCTSLDRVSNEFHTQSRCSKLHTIYSPDEHCSSLTIRNRRVRRPATHGWSNEVMVVISGYDISLSPDVLLCRSTECVNQMSKLAIPLVMNRITIAVINHQDKINLSHNGLNPAHVPWYVQSNV